MEKGPESLNMAWVGDIVLYWNSSWLWERPFKPFSNLQSWGVMFHGSFMKGGQRFQPIKDSPRWLVSRWVPPHKAHIRTIMFCEACASLLQRYPPDIYASETVPGTKTSDKESEPPKACKTMAKKPLDLAPKPLMLRNYWGPGQTKKLKP